MPNLENENYHFGCGHPQTCDCKERRREKVSLSNLDKTDYGCSHHFVFSHQEKGTRSIPNMDGSEGVELEVMLDVVVCIKCGEVRRNHA